MAAEQQTVPNGQLKVAEFAGQQTGKSSLLQPPGRAARRAVRATGTQLGIRPWWTAAVVHAAEPAAIELGTALVFADRSRAFAKVPSAGNRLTALIATAIRWARLLPRANILRRRCLGQWVRVSAVALSPPPSLLPVCWRRFLRSASASGAGPRPSRPAGADTYHALLPGILGYGVVVLAVAVKRAMLVTETVAASSLSLRTSPAAFGGTRAESPSLSVNSVLAGIASGSVGTDMPGSTPRPTFMGASMRMVRVPEFTNMRFTDGSVGSMGSVAPGANVTRPSSRFAVPGDKTSIVPEASVENDTPEGTIIGQRTGVSAWFDGRDGK